MWDKFFYVEADRNDKIIKDIASAIESATHAIPGVSLTNATRQNRLNLSVTRSEHQWAQKRHAFHTQFIGLCRVTRRAITIVLFGVFCPRFHVSPSEDHTQRAMSFDQISNHKSSHTKISDGDNQYGIDGGGDVGNSNVQFWLFSVQRVSSAESIFGVIAMRLRPHLARLRQTNGKTSAAVLVNVSVSLPEVRLRVSNSRLFLESWLQPYL